jgi:hypothetical protein
MQGGEGALLGDNEQKEKKTLSPESLLDLCMRKLRQGRVGRMERCRARGLQAPCVGLGALKTSGRRIAKARLGSASRGLGIGPGGEGIY